MYHAYERETSDPSSTYPWGANGESDADFVNTSTVHSVSDSSSSSSSSRVIDDLVTQQPLLLVEDVDQLMDEIRRCGRDTKVWMRWGVDA